MELYPLSVEGFRLLSAEASNDQIAELVGMPFGIFTNTVLFVQRTRGRTVTDFLDQDDAGQKKIFSTLFNLDCYAEALELVKPDARLARAQFDQRAVSQREHGLQQASDQATLETLRRNADEHDSLQLQLVSIAQENLAVVKRRLAELELADPQAELAALQTRIDALTRDHKALQDQVTAVRVRHTTVLTTISAKRERLAEPAPTCDLTPPVAVPAPNVQRKAELEDAMRTLQAEKSQQEADRKIYSTRKAELEQRILAAQQALLVATQRQAQTEELRAELVRKIEGITVCPTCQQEFTTPDAKEVALKDLAERLAQLQDTDLEQPQQVVTQAEQALQGLVPFDAAAYAELTTAYDTYAAELQVVAQASRAFTTYEKQLAIYEESKRNAEKASLAFAAKQSSLTLELKQLEAELPGLVDQLAQHAQALLEQDTLLQGALAAKVHLETQRAPIQDLRNQLPALDKAVVDATNKEFPDRAWLERTAQAVKKREAELQRLAAEQEVATQRLAVLDALQEAFGKEGIIACLFQEYIPDIQRLANEYLLALTNGELEITFSADRELKRKVDGVAATRSQFDIQVAKRNGGSDYDLISGSEQNKAALVVNWALADLAYYHSNVSCNVRVFDEVFESLDAKSTERLVALLLRHAQSSGQTNLVITHSVELEDAFPAKIILRKENGASRLV